MRHRYEIEGFGQSNTDFQSDLWVYSDKELRMYIDVEIDSDDYNLEVVYFPDELEGLYAKVTTPTVGQYSFDWVIEDCEDYLSINDSQIICTKPPEHDRSTAKKIEINVIPGRAQGTNTDDWLYPEASLMTQITIGDDSYFNSYLDLDNLVMYEKANNWYIREEKYN